MVRETGQKMGKKLNSKNYFKKSGKILIFKL